MNTIELLTPEDGMTTSELQAFRSADSDQRATSAGEPDRPGCCALPWAASGQTPDDRSVPRPVCFAWQESTTASESRVFDLYIATEPTFACPLVFSELPQPYRHVLNLRTGTRYYWKVVARDGRSVLAASAVRSFTTHPAPPRWLYVPGTTNVRDMGGWSLPGNRRVRQGLVYRSSEMNGHVDITDDGKRVLVEEVGIRTDVDLRGSNGPAMAVLDESRVTWVNIPIKPYDNIITDSESYRQVFEVLSDPSTYPILFHCWGGCDRGGTVAYLLHAVLGLDPEDLIRDYELSSHSIWGARSHRSDEFQSLLTALLPFGDGNDDMPARVERYLLSIGTTADSIAAIRENLIEATDD